RQTHRLEPRADPLPDGARVLADAAREDHGVRTAHLRVERADVLADTAAEDVDREARAPILVLGLLFEQLAHVSRQARDPEKSRLLVQKSLDLVERHPFLVREEGEDGRIE